MIGIGSTTPTYKLEVVAGGKAYADHFKVRCPTLFGSLERNGIQLGCIKRTKITSTLSYSAANDNCFDTYGGRLPTIAELSAADTYPPSGGYTKNSTYGWSATLHVKDKALKYAQGDDIDESALTDTNQFRCFIPK